MILTDYKISIKKYTRGGSIHNHLCNRIAPSTKIRKTSKQHSLTKLRASAFNMYGFAELLRTLSSFSTSFKAS